MFNAENVFQREFGDYLLPAVRSLFQNVGSNRARVSFIVYVGENDTNYVKNRSQEIFEVFSRDSYNNTLQVFLIVL